MNYEEEYLNAIMDTSELVAKDKATYISKISNTALAHQQSNLLANEVEFWKWMGSNYPKDLGSLSQIQNTAIEKERWLSIQLQGKGYEWDYMSMQRSNPQKMLSMFEAGDCPTQPGIDITETGIIDGKTIQTYQNKAYVSSNSPDLHNTPHDAIVVTNEEKISYAESQGYETESFMDREEIISVRDERYEKALEGKVNSSYSVKNVATTSLKAGAIAAVIAMTTETIVSYRAWKRGELTDKQYLTEIAKTGGEAGITTAATTAIMIPVNATITALGVSSLFSIPIAIIVSKGINDVIAPCFGRGNYKAILNEVKYYQKLDALYEDFVTKIEQTAFEYTDYLNTIKSQRKDSENLKSISKQLDKQLEELYDKI